MSSEQGYLEGEIETGERIMQSPITCQKYLVTKWVEKPDGRAIALEKEEYDGE